MSMILVAGTNSWDNDDDVDWFHPKHPFAKMLQDSGISVLDDNGLPFIWTTNVDGLVVERKNHIDWSAGGAALSYFTRMKQETVPDIIAHSHGLQVVLYACANHGMRVNVLISVGSPVRKDMEEIAKKARLNIGHWIHIHSDKSDKWQWLGELFDGKFGIVREHPLADRNDFVPKVGHSELLRDPKKYPLWKQKGWLDYVGISR